MNLKLKNKLAIVTNGGGMLCSYSAGALYAIFELYKLNPDIVVGSSGSAGSLAYYVAQQPNSIKNIWTNLLATNKFISLKRIFKIMDLDYLIDFVFRQQDPLNVGEIKKSETCLYISATRSDTGETKFFTNTDDIFQALKITKAIPFITAQKVMADNVEYIDGSIGATFDVNIKKAIQEGAAHVIVINDSSELSFIAKTFWWFYSLFANKNIRKLLKEYVKQVSPRASYYKDINIIVIEPSRIIKIHSLDNNREHLRKSFELGYQDIQSNNDLRIFIQKYNDEHINI